MEAKDPLDMAQVFDRLLESSSTRLATEGSRPSFAGSVLPLRQRQMPKFLPHKEREIAAVDESLKAVFRQLASGKAAWPLFVHGPPGTGKTCAALALLDHLAHHHQQFITASELVWQVMDSFGGRGERFDWRRFGHYFEEDGMMSSRKGCHLLVLDELGSRDKVSDTHYEAVQRVIDMREGHALVLISNLDIAGIGRAYDARIASRCEAGTVVALQGRDRRVSP